MDLSHPRSMTTRFGIFGTHTVRFAPGGNPGRGAPLEAKRPTGAGLFPSCG
jgi:hypothetical protein